MEQEQEQEQEQEHDRENLQSIHFPFQSTWFFYLPFFLSLPRPLTRITRSLHSLLCSAPPDLDRASSLLILPAPASPSGHSTRELAFAQSGAIGAHDVAPKPSVSDATSHVSSAAN
ncbi:hypothetical protein CGMCC3_g8165 [Colletotrichum fructicola]|nr:uncharacterized protein CGMCC3_g8165 [Colletotrichum fructicola]KAE9575877.1 hypothetical protein CGMCC3_g8165 [Colletotrichum fructicola]